MTRLYAAARPAPADDLPIAEDDEKLLNAIVLGETIEAAIADRHSPFSLMLRNARTEMIEALTSLIDPEITDLFSDEGIKKARKLQATVDRYRAMCAWISVAMHDAEEAETQHFDADEEGEPAIEQLKEMTYGQRAKPAHDA